MSEASEVGEFHCCCTGDCPHERVHQCVDSLTEHIKELAADYRRLEAAAENVISVARMSSDGRYGTVSDELINELEESIKTP